MRAIRQYMRPRVIAACWLVVVLVAFVIVAPKVLGVLAVIICFIAFVVVTVWAIAEVSTGDWRG